ncbi:3-dehydroquinate synthase II family protein [Paenibacillus chitinolyticus]|uniref:3-dehydroquinate synthase II family protein n=1 Tax=Paenibacillus chitinolyticus TaxID=79263 RepID=UPI0035E1A994
MSKALKETPDINPKASNDSTTQPTEKPAETKTNGTAAPVSSLNQAKNKPIAPVRSKYAWFDISSLTAPEQWGAIVQALPHQKFTGVVANEQQVKQLPPTLDKITYVVGTPSPDKLTALNEAYDIVILEPSVISSSWFRRNREAITCKIGTSVNVTDPESLQLAVAMTHEVSLLIVEFRDDTKIPLEIVLADAQNFGTEVVMKVRDDIEAKVVFGVLECGADGVLIASGDLGQVYAVGEVITSTGQKGGQPLQKLTIVRTEHVGMGDRACIDLTSYLGLDEGVLLGSFSCGGILACSETHPLPYMPTRPFRINAGSLHTYVLAPDNRTWYLSDLRSGMEVLVVSTSGKARRVSVGRVKIERRPLLYIEARAEDGTTLNVIMQEDWHVRVFGTEGQPINITTLKPGDQVLGYTMDPGRHVGVKVDELIIEQ